MADTCALVPLCNSCYIRNCRSFNSIQHRSNTLFFLDRRLMRYFYLSVNVAAILENGGYRRSAIHGQLAPSKMLFYTLIRFQLHITHLISIEEPTRYRLPPDYIDRQRHVGPLSLMSTLSGAESLEVF